MTRKLFQHIRIFSALLSALLVVGSFVFVYQKGFNSGVDFAGGVMIELSNLNNTKVDVLKERMDRKLNVNTIVYYVEQNVVIKAKAVQDLSQQIEEMKNVINNFDKTIEIRKIDSVSPHMTGVFIKNSIIASLCALLGIFIYIVIRFDLKFAIAGTLALLHDTIITIGLIAFTRIELNLITVTAILTIIGYCINDKIVVFDRIRSNFGLTSSDNLDIVKVSILSVLVRSIMTSVATTIVACSLLFFGDVSIYEFGVSTICGIAVGTYSSLFIAPNILLLIGFSRIKKVQKAKDPMFYAS
ncbi:MAG: SecYEG protein translocase auxillary subunit [Pseudomonadota bacterium]|jgi:preprotein translocase subunit SecF